MKITRFQDIPKYPHCSYRVDIGWDYLEEHITRAKEAYGLDLNPDFQRHHIWTERQQIEYCEYILKGGSSGKELYFNANGWMGTFKGPYVIVDGKQRLQAVRQFMSNKIPVFETYLKDFEDRMRFTTATLSWNIASLKTKEEILQWYINFNAGGTPHTKEEIEKVKNMLMNKEK